MTDENGSTVIHAGVMEAVEAGIDKVLATASVNAVYGKPVRQGDTLIIPAAEVLSVTGFGMGEGSGTSPAKPNETPTEESSAAPQEEPKMSSGSGSGGGGGGKTFARPVAVIIVSPEGVEVRPVLDMTKIGLAALTTFGFMLATLARIRRGK